MVYAVPGTTPTFKPPKLLILALVREGPKIAPLLCLLLSSQAFLSFLSASCLYASLQDRVWGLEQLYPVRVGTGGSGPWEPVVFQQVGSLSHCVLPSHQQRLNPHCLATSLSQVVTSWLKVGAEVWLFGNNICISCSQFLSNMGRCGGTFLSQSMEGEKTAEY